MSEPTERWLPVPGYEGLYEISDLGRVWSVSRRTRGAPRQFRGRQGGGRFLNPWIMNAGYPAVELWRDGQRDPRLVHLLVMEAFEGPCPPGQETRHGPNGGGDASLANLSRGTHMENMDDQLRDGTRNRGERAGCAKLTEDDVREIRELLALRVPQTSIAARFGVRQMAISDINCRKTWTHVT